MLNQENMPGAGSVADTIEFMKQMWSGVGAPSMAMPSLSVEDINKKISDLKTVASWLELNMNMLKATIQTLEVQSATLSTLQAMSAIMASRGMPQAAADGEQEQGAAPAFPFRFPMWPGMAPADAGDEGDEGDEAAADAAPEAAPPAAAEAAEEDAAGAAAGAPAPEDAPADAELPPPPDFQAAMANPNAWWNLLQEQFSHAVGNALAANANASVGTQAPLPKPAKPGRGAKRSEKKTVTSRPDTGRSASARGSKANGVGKPADKAVSKGAAAAKAAPKGAKKPATKAAPARPAAAKASGRAGNTSASARTPVVQSGQTKKPASRKPISP